MAIEGASEHVFLVSPPGAVYSSMTLDADKEDDAIIRVQPQSITGKPLALSLISAKLNLLNNAYFKKSQYEMGDLVKTIEGHFVLDFRSVFSRLELGSYLIDLDVQTEDGRVASTTLLFNLKGTIIDAINVAMGQAKTWTDEYEYIETDNFPKALPEVSTSQFPILQMTISTKFLNSLATQNDHIENVFVQFQKGNEEPLQIVADYNKEKEQFIAGSNLRFLFRDGKVNGNYSVKVLCHDSRALNTVVKDLGFIHINFQSGSYSNVNTRMHP